MKNVIGVMTKSQRASARWYLDLTTALGAGRILGQECDARLLFQYFSRHCFFFVVFPLRIVSFSVQSYTSSRSVYSSFYA